MIAVTLLSKVHRTKRNHHRQRDKFMAADGSCGSEHIVAASIRVRQCRVLLKGCLCKLNSSPALFQSTFLGLTAFEGAM